MFRGLCVCLSVCVLGTPVDLEETDKPIAMPLWSKFVCPRNHTAAHWNHLTNITERDLD